VTFGRVNSGKFSFLNSTWQLDSGLRFAKIFVMSLEVNMDACFLGEGYTIAAMSYIALFNKQVKIQPFLIHTRMHANNVGTDDWFGVC